MHTSNRYSAAIAVVSALFALPSLSAQTFTFGPPKVVAANSGSPSPLDLNGDGKTDLYLTAGAFLNGGVYLGNGSGSFAATPVPVQLTGLTNLQSGPNFIDVNGDGKADMVFIYGGSYAPGEPFNYQGLFAVALGDGKGNFTGTANFTLDYGPGSSFVTGDFNHDGKLDFAVVVADSFVSQIGGSSSVTVFTNTGAGTFRQSNYASIPGFPDALAVGDFNGDGKLDLAWTDGALEGTAKNAYAIRCAYGNGDGTFRSQQVCYTTDGRPFGIAGSDLNHDGKADLVVGIGPKLDANGNTISGALPRIATLRAKASGGFYWLAVTTSLVYPESFQLQDLNGDGILDVNLVNAVLFPGRSGGSFGTGQRVPPATPLFLTPLSKGGLPALFSSDSSGIVEQLNTSKK
jgi:FG-GAP-like repeat